MGSFENSAFMPSHLNLFWDYGLFLSKCEFSRKLSRDCVNRENASLLWSYKNNVYYSPPTLSPVCVCLYNYVYATFCMYLGVRACTWVWEPMEAGGWCWQSPSICRLPYSRRQSLAVQPRTHRGGSPREPAYSGDPGFVFWAGGTDGSLQVFWESEL